MIILPEKTSIRNRTGKHSKNICLHTELTAIKNKYNQIVTSQKEYQSYM